MAQSQAQQQKNKATASKTNNEEGVPIINSPNPDNAWKAVGSPSRRGSTTAMSHFFDSSNRISPNDSPINDHIDVVRRSSVVSENNNNNNSNNNGGGNWGSFGGFQWEGPSIFDEEGKPVSTSAVPPSQPPDAIDNYSSGILSVPMLPGVSLEPIYRQQRSLSFSMGQDPTFFGYDDYEDQPSQPPQQYLKQPTFNSSLAPMEEEEDGYMEDFDFSYIRSRSKSSGAAFGLLSQNQHSRLMNNGHIRRGSEQQDDLLINQRRRSSSRFFNLPEQPASNSQMSLGDKERLDLLQRRLSQQQQLQEYSFPENPATSNYNMMRRQSLTLNAQSPNNIQQLADQLEGTHLRSDIPNLSGFQPQQQQQQPQQYIRPELYMQSQQPNYHNPSSYLHLQQQPYPTNNNNINNSNNNHLQHHHLQHPAQQTPHQQQQVADDYFDTDPRGFQDLGKGYPISKLDPNSSLYMVEFKGGRTDFFYVPESSQLHPQIGDLVIVEADRGKDLGKVAVNTLTIDQVLELEQKKQLQLQQLESNNNEKEKEKEEDAAAAAAATPKAQREIHIKRIFRLAAPDEINLLLVKGQDEHKALVVCQQKTKQRKLPMEVVDAEYQWDRRKLTFFFEAENRIDFRELVRELFKIYKTRIWMCVVTPPITVDDIPAPAATSTNTTASNATAAPTTS